MSMQPATTGQALPAKTVIELCVETVEAAQAAQQGGANRIELCRSLEVGGLTPGPGLLQGVLEGTRLPVHSMVRPRGGDFMYSDEEVRSMESAIAVARSAGCAGIVLGVLRADGSVDTARLRHLVRLAGPMEVTFHRAFDETKDVPSALEAVISAGVTRVLTSGSCATAILGAGMIARLVEQAAGRVAIAAGCGLHAGNVRGLLNDTGVPHVHASLRRSANGVDARVTAEAVRKFVMTVRGTRGAAHEESD